MIFILWGGLALAGGEGRACLNGQALFCYFFSPASSSAR